LFAPVVTALTGGMLFLFALSRGYHQRTAFVGVLLFGLTTIAWPYTQTFFREPLAGFALLSTAFFLEQWRVQSLRSGNTHLWWIIPGVTMGAVLLATKDAMLLATPSLLAVVFPEIGALRRQRHKLFRLLLILVSVAGLALILIMSRNDLGIFTNRYMVPTRIRSLAEGIPHAWAG